ncbi:MAG: hypothetical protein Tsb0020_17040 [Haliangiales bacterium]
MVPGSANGPAHTGAVRDATAATAGSEIRMVLVVFFVLVVLVVFVVFFVFFVFVRRLMLGLHCKKVSVLSAALVGETEAQPRPPQGPRGEAEVNR